MQWYNIYIILRSPSHNCLVCHGSRSCAWQVLQGARVVYLPAPASSRKLDMQSETSADLQAELSGKMNADEQKQT